MISSELPEILGMSDRILVMHEGRKVGMIDDPATAIATAAEALGPRGKLLIVDFAPHTLEILRSQYAHRRLGFDDAEVSAWCRAAGLEDVRVEHLTVSGANDAEKLTVSLWVSVQRADAPSHYQLDVA